MSEEKRESVIDVSKWVSTYGLITVERILEHYKIRSNQIDLINALKVPNSFYNELIRIPMRNIFNGIIFQQARDYQVYSQKLFIDYLLSGESSKEPESPGAYTREILEQERQRLVALGEKFHQLELSQEKLIADSQVMLMRHATDWIKSMQVVSSRLNRKLQELGVYVPTAVLAKCLEALLVQYDFNVESSTITEEYWSRVENLTSITLNKEIRQVFVENLLSFKEFSTDSNSSAQEFLMLASEMSRDLKQFRSDFHATIITVSELMRQLPDYHMDMAQIELNKEDLHFDSGIGST